MTTRLEGAHARATRLHATLRHLGKSVGAVDASAEVRSELRAVVGLLADEALLLAEDLDSVHWPDDPDREPASRAREKSAGARS